MNLNNPALTEFAATVTALQSQSMPITEAEYNALVAKMQQEDHPLTEEQCRLMDRLKAEIAARETLAESGVRLPDINE
jgi:hypothetical protein